MAACKDGKMSQAVASVTYQIPKTTIWRRLQKEIGKSDSGTSVKKQQKRIICTTQKSDEIVKSEELQETDFEAYCPV